jgi:hypothetical protein
MCHCYVPFRGVIDIFVLALKVRYFASEDGRGTNPFPTTRVRLCLGILSSCLQEPLVVGARGLSSWG